MATDRTGTEYVRVLAENERYVAQYRHAALPVRPARKLAVVTCMDARIPVEDVLGLLPGDAHVIRNAGGLATDDAIRSLVISQQLLGTEEVVVIAHTGCGMLAFRDDEVQRDIATRTGAEVDLPLGAFEELEGNLRSQVDRIRDHPWTKDVPVHGLVFELESGRLRELG